MERKNLNAEMKYIRTELDRSLTQGQAGSPQGVSEVEDEARRADWTLSLPDQHPRPG